MSDLFVYISSWSFLKWIVLVLIAGFIGQFGKMAAEIIAKKIRPNREKKDIAPVAPVKTRVRQSSPDTPASTPAQQSAPDTLTKPQEQQASLDTPASTPGQQSAPDEITDKKILKSMAKARKKNAKKTIGLVIGSFRKRL